MSGKIEIGLASNEDGDDIHSLLHSSGVLIEGLDWNDIYPHWLVAEMDGDIVGCFQVCLGKPIGFVEFLATDKALSHIKHDFV